MTLQGIRDEVRSELTLDDQIAWRLSVADSLCREYGFPMPRAMRAAWNWQMEHGDELPAADVAAMIARR